MNSLTKSVVTPLVFALALMGSSIPGAIAQESTPVVDFQRPLTPEELLFDPAALGDGWILVDPVVTDVINTATWEAAATAVYSGPNGNRVSVAIRYVQNDRQAILNAEEAIDNLFYEYEYYDLNDAVDPERELVVGCDSMRRIEGSNHWWRVTGLSSCTVGLDLAIWVEVQGSALGLSGSAASDAVIALMLGE